MKLVIAFLFAFTLSALGNQSEVRDASVTNFPDAYSGANAELLSNIRANRICCQNWTGSAAGICLRANTAAACDDDWYLPDKGNFCFDDHPLPSSVFVRGWSAAITSGIFQCRVWIRN